jgi:L-aspartate oxidase
MGGVWTDADGRTSLEGLYAVGECASTGVHGANRLASNSLLEAAVFGLRAGHAARAEVDPKTLPDPSEPPPELPPDALPALRRSMSLNAGVERTAEGLQRLLGEIDALAARHGEALVLTAARLVAQAALDRRESRGGHWRLDFPEPAAEARRTFTGLQPALREAAE